MSYESIPSSDPVPPGSTPSEPSSPAPPPSGPTARTWIIGGVVSVIIAAGAIIGINAASGDDTTVDTTATAATADASGSGATDQSGMPGAPSGMPGGGTFGTIDSVDGTTIQLTDQSGTATKVVTTEDTVITSSAEATVADLAVGDNVRVVGSGTATEIAADRVVDSGDVAASDAGGFGGPGGGGGSGGTPPAGMTPPADGELPDGFTPPADGELPDGFTPPADGQMPAGAPNGQAGDRASASGTITSIDGTTMIVTADDGSTVTVTLSDSTTVTTTSVITVADLAAGDSIMVRGETADGVLTAVSISEGTGGFGGFGGGMPGGARPSGAAPTDSNSGSN